MTTSPVFPQVPSATYRVQFNGNFTFRAAAAIAGYLHDLGVTHLYASPYFKAKPHSLHGYDIVDHGTLNPEIGTEEDLRLLHGELERLGMGQILDIVPNHMCIESPDNGWWMDVLENGPSASFARAFDVDWAPVKKELLNKVLIPVLGDQYGNVLERRELRLRYDDGAFFIVYYDHRFPVRPQSCALVLEYRLDELKAALSAADPDLAEYLSIITALERLPGYLETDPRRIGERYREKEVAKRRLVALLERSAAIREHLERTVGLFNGTAGEPRSFDLLDNLLDAQIYRLADWRVAAEEINYRRFFDVNSLGAIRMENAEVFRASHAFLFRLVRDGIVTGLRVDHPDGLYNPVEYFHRLQRGCYVQRSLARATETGGDEEEQERQYCREYDGFALADPAFKPFYIVGEKILGKSERMPEDWPIFSTTGYVFLNSVNGIFVDGSHAKALAAIYNKFTRTNLTFADVIYEKKKLVMQVSMASEVNMLSHYLNDLSERNRHTRDFTLNSLTAAIVEIIACFPVYRTYINSWTVADRDRQYIDLATAKAKRRNPAISASVFEFLRDVLLLRFPENATVDDKSAWLDFTLRFQQLTGPVMAKGVEDTAFYVYNRLASLNEVGGAPDRFGTTLETFHGQNIERSKNWPHAMIATSTHDTKRSEDVRARIDVLSEMPKEWADRVRQWTRMNRKRKTLVEGREAPDRNEEYLLYQTLIGAWPAGDPGERELENVRRRIGEYMLKAAREAKVNTSWINPDGAYEEALAGFIEKVLRPGSRNVFLKDFIAFQRMISHFGMYNSLSQTLLKICAPGVPDFYQGTELWDYSLVDPDNRQPVDYEKRVAALNGLREAERTSTGVELCRDLSFAKNDGRIKLYCIWKALTFRREHPRLFQEGEYLPFAATGSRAEHLCAFARRGAGLSAVVAVPRFLTGMISGTGSVPFGKAVWEDTKLVPDEAAANRQYRNVFTAEVIATGRDGTLPAADLFASFPVALLEGLQ